MIFKPSRGALNGFLRSLGVSKRESNIDIYTSSNYIDEDGSERDPWLIFKYTNDRWASHEDDVNPWIQINLKNHYISLTNYSIKQSVTGFYFRGWKFEVSNDNFSSSMTLDNFSNYTLVQNHETIIRPVYYEKGIASAFNAFRVSMTQKSNLDSIMRVTSVEFFGRVFSSNECSLITKRRCSTLHLYIALLFLS